MIHKYELQFEIWKNHPTYENYCGSSLGHVKNVKTDKLLLGYKDVYGYIKIALPNNIRISLHKFIYECFNGIIDSSKYDIDHIDNDKESYDYNFLRNLQALTRKDHGVKTADQNIDILKKPRPSKRNVYRIKIKNNVEIERIIYDTVVDAGKELDGGQPDQIIDCCNGKLESHKGYMWEWVKLNDLEGEYWVSLRNPKYDRCMVSNLGRVEHRGFRTFGSNHGPYLVKHLKNVSYYVHNLVCIAFYGEAPSPTHTADHIISSEKTNNKIENLRWATKIEQTNNRIGMKKVQCLDKNDILIKIYNSQYEAARELNIKAAHHIYDVCVGRRKHCCGFKWNFVVE